MTLKRYGMYLSPDDDPQLLAELDACTVRGRKSELLRGYALRGYEMAMEICATSQDPAAATKALAELFGPGMQLDYRQASKFLAARRAGEPQGGVLPGAAAAPTPASTVVATTPATVIAVPQASTTPDAAQAAEVAPVKPPKDWKFLQGLGGKQSTPADDKGKS